MGFNEIAQLAARYNISVDQVIGVQSDAFVFSGKINNGEAEPFGQYMDDLEKNFAYFNSFSENKMSTLVKDIPPYVHLPHDRN